MADTPPAAAAAAVTSCPGWVQTQYASEAGAGVGAAVGSPARRLLLDKGTCTGAWSPFGTPSPPSTSIAAAAPPGSNLLLPPWSVAASALAPVTAPTAPSSEAAVSRWAPRSPSQQAPPALSPPPPPPTTPLPGSPPRPTSPPPAQCHSPPPPSRPHGHPPSAVPLGEPIGAVRRRGAPRAVQPPAVGATVTTDGVTAGATVAASAAVAATLTLAARPSPPLATVRCRRRTHHHRDPHRLAGTPARRRCHRDGC